MLRKHFARVRDSGNDVKKLRDSGIYQKLARDSGSRSPLPDPVELGLILLMLAKQHSLYFPPFFACNYSRVPHYLNAWNRLEDAQILFKVRLPTVRLFSWGPSSILNHKQARSQKVAVEQKETSRPPSCLVPVLLSGCSRPNFVSSVILSSQKVSF